eukprot:g11344.t1
MDRPVSQLLRFEMTFDAGCCTDQLLAGNWPVYARPVLEYVGHGFVIFYLLYITFVVFAVIRVISAIFLRETLEAANNDAEIRLQDRLHKKSTYVRKLEGLDSLVHRGVVGPASRSLQIT